MGLKKDFFPLTDLACQLLYATIQYIIVNCTFSYRAFLLVNFSPRLPAKQSKTLPKAREPQKVNNKA